MTVRLRRFCQRAAIVTSASLLTFLPAITTMAADTEEPKYTVEAREGEMEIRRYAPMIVAETDVSGEFEGAGNRGFRVLADYIFGNNRSRQEIAMTAPVTQRPPSSEKIAMTAPVRQQPVREQATAPSWTVSFVMPAAYTMDTLPRPVDPRVRLRGLRGGGGRVPPFPGTGAARRFQHEENRLRFWLTERGETPTSEASWARFDPPWKPWFLRRNEIQLDLTSTAPPTFVP